MQPPKLAFFSRKMPREACEAVLAPELAQGKPLAVGWGRKKSGERARRWSRHFGSRFLAIEDGFYRSLDLGVKGAPPLSLCVDGEGIYYDASAPSDLERLLEGTGWETEELLAEADACMAAIASQDLSKYNAQPPLEADPWEGCEGPRVLVADQTAGDRSVSCGMADAASFRLMLEEACARYPRANVRVKVHPDVLCGKKQGYLAEAARELGVGVIASACSPVSLLRRCDVVYAVTSQLGFEALVLGKKVVCFGMPFYAGWGATDDRLTCPRRTRRRTVREIFAAACLVYARYWDPVRRQACTARETLRLLAAQRRQNERNRGVHCCAGFKFWKRPHAKAYLQCTEGRKLKFFWTVGGAARAAAKLGGDVVVWSSKVTPDVQRICAEAGVPLTRMEDGFLRSVGLGSDFRYPYSLVLDRKGIYYDPSRPSDLEDILNGMPGRPDREELRCRARLLVKDIVSRGITKYDAGLSGGIEDLPRDRKIILVPGQVENDASVRTGGGGIRSNRDLLEAVRRAEPDAYLIYKPHPDVDQNARKGRLRDKDALSLCDRVVRRVPMAALLKQVDGVHTLTSLTGFEALLRGIPVACWGQPFYAGWGLTEDHAEHPRRKARLTVDDLAAGTLILYPSYYDWELRQFTTPEHVCFRLAEQSSLRERKAPLRNAGFFLRNYARLRACVLGCLRKLSS